MINHISILTNPKGSNVYRKICIGFYTTPSGSHILESSFFYKHQIPSGLLLESIEANIQKGINELKQMI